MKKIIISSFFTAEIAAFSMLMLLFFLNTNKPHLLLVPIILQVIGYFIYTRLLLKKSEGNKAIPYMISFPLFLGFIISAAVIGMLYFVR